MSSNYVKDLDSSLKAHRPVLATNGGERHRLATPEHWVVGGVIPGHRTSCAFQGAIPPGADIRDRTSALLDFCRLYHQVRTLRKGARFVSC